jgi:hypothetical protein
MRAEETEKNIERQEYKWNSFTKRKEYTVMTKMGR